MKKIIGVSIAFLIIVSAINMFAESKKDNAQNDNKAKVKSPFLRSGNDMKAGDVGNLIKETEERKNLPATISIESKGKVAQSENINAKKTWYLPVGSPLMLQGKVSYDQSVNGVILTLDTGKEYMLFNAPYTNTLRFEGMGREIKVLGKYIGQITKKDYPALFIDDIVSVK